jgi:Kdo2-lipid IVA lauroyltransferase/acyltransferase
MRLILFYFLLPIIYLISLLPFKLLYIFSDALFILTYRIIGYRKKVILNNLRNSFPEKSEEEIKEIARNFYAFFCDLIAETIKTLTISPDKLNQRAKFTNEALIAEYYQKNQSLIYLMGHYGNWEFGGNGFSMLGYHRLITIYHPLSDKNFDRLLYKMRTRLGNGLYAMNNTLRGMISDKNKITATAFLADQTPPPENAYWTSFLNQDTPFFTGAEKLAKKFNYPVVYISVQKVKRGYFNVNAELLVADPSKTQEGEITEIFVRRLEKDIVNKPEFWLWSHRRWKHKKISSLSPSQI